MGLGETKCPAIVAPENRHALPSRLLLTGRRPVCSRRAPPPFRWYARPLVSHYSYGSRDRQSRLTLTPNGVRSSTGRRKRLPSSRSFRLLTDRRPVRMVCETFGLALLATTSRSVIDRPHSFGRSAPGSLRSPSLLTGLRPVRIVRGPPVPRYSLSRRSLRLRAALPREWSARPEVSHQPRLADSARHRTPVGRSGVTRCSPILTAVESKHSAATE